MQTFVLAPQSAKKYYVHNDIFRYQDEVFTEDESSDPEGEDIVGFFILFLQMFVNKVADIVLDLLVFIDCCMVLVPGGWNQYQL